MSAIQKIATLIKRGWRHYLKINTRFPLSITLGAFVAGIVFWGGLNTTMELTNTEAFCISCHEMEQNVYQEYKKTIHYANRTGVRATCPDCHVPKEWSHMVVRKISATNELFHKLIGSINSKEKFQAKRLQLAQYVWRQMAQTDSRECRNCHNFDFMALENQKKISYKKHKRAQQQNMTCIDCHIGIAHQLPKDFDQDGQLHGLYKQQNRSCSDCHKEMAQSADEW